MAAWNEIRRKLDALRERDREQKVLGASSHLYRLNERISAGELVDLERRFAVRFPDDYRAYLLEFSNGGAGPAYGVYRAGRYNDGLDDLPWEEGYCLGNPANAFRFRDKWNLPPECWEEGRDDERAEALGAEALREVGYPVPPPTGRIISGRNPFTGETFTVPETPSAFGRYLEGGLMDGAVPICYLGCNLQLWLVVSGLERGHVWRDLRADNDGVEPVKRGGKARVTFSDWYEAWIDDALRDPGA